MEDFKIRATELNIKITENHGLTETENEYTVLNSTAVIDENWIKFYLNGHTKAMFYSGQITKKGFLKEAGY